MNPDDQQTIFLPGEERRRALRRIEARLEEERSAPQGVYWVREMIRSRQHYEPWKEEGKRHDD